MLLTEKSLDELRLEISDKFLLDSYLSSIKAGEITADPYQKAVILELQEIFNSLLRPIATSSKSRSHFSRFISLVSEKQPQTTSKTKPIKGLYLWGGVGRGKTHLVNYFYKLLPTEKKLRLHYHRFMELVHEELNELDGIANPLEIVAKNFARKTQLLCLDEMHVNDITDAMLLGKLFEHLFDLGVVLVTTSNIPPDQLYKNGLQRERFLPAIELLENHTKVVKIEGDEDYRQKFLENNAIYYLSSGKFKESISEQRLAYYFHKLSGIELHQDRTDIIIKNRKIPVKMWADGVVWFDFDELCNTPKSVADYSHIAKYFHTFLISDIPVMDNTMDDVARRFVNLIDTLYDKHINIIISAFAEPESLYTGNRLAFEFQRTASRLHEMQSEDYIKVRHFS